MKLALNVLGGALAPCSAEPLTGFYRNGCCDTGPDDFGQHTVCVIVDDKFLEFSKEVGNDLSTPNEPFRFPGLKAGDKWCLCVTRWAQAFDAGCAPKVVLAATHKEALQVVTLEDLTQHSSAE